jgi:hypothetical protein
MGALRLFVLFFDFRRSTKGHSESTMVYVYQVDLLAICNKFGDDFKFGPGKQVF